MTNIDCFMMKSGKCGNFNCRGGYFPDCDYKQQGASNAPVQDNGGGFFAICPQCGFKIPLEDDDDDDE